MKRILSILLIHLFLTNCLSAQTTIFSENWTSGGSGWTLNVVTGPEEADPNFWKVSAEEGGGITPNLGAPGSCGVPNNGNNCLFVTSVFNPTGGAAYDAGGSCGILFCPQADRRTESPVINCTGSSTLTLNFNYIENGQGTIDNATLWFNDGSGWIQIDDMPKTLTGCGGQGLWTSRSIPLPATANNNPNVKIAFRWVNNDDGIGTDPSFAVDNITITKPLAGSLPVVTIIPSPNDTICQNATLTLNGSATNGPITSWAWTVNPAIGVVFNPNANAQKPTVTFTTPGTYTFTLQATNSSGTGSGTQVITVIQNASASFSTTVVAPGIPQTILFTNTSQNAIGYVWDFSDAPNSILVNPSHTFNAAGTYTITLTAYGIFNCNNTISTILLISDSVGISVPNIFTPNGDNINDVFKPSVHGAATFECTIYNRWGIKVYEFAGAQDYWDGFTTAGLACQEGTYYYILKATDIKNKSYDLKGFIQLIR